VQPAEPSAIEPTESERTNLDVHKEKVGRQILALFDAVDKGVGQWIGYSGNIREELKGRLVPTTRYTHELATEGLDSSLQAHVRNDIFFFRRDDADGGPAAMYKIDCQLGRFTPSISVANPDGWFEASLFMGPDRDEFYRAYLRRAFNDHHVRTITTFTSNYLDPPHPLVISEGGFSVADVFAVYDDIDVDGNVTLLDQQTIRDPTDVFSGRYSAADHTISPTRGGSVFPYTRGDGCLLIGEEGKRQARLPLQTNIYTELEDISGIMKSIAPQ